MADEVEGNWIVNRLRENGQDVDSLIWDQQDER